MRRCLPGQIFAGLLLCCCVTPQTRAEDSAVQTGPPHRVLVGDYSKQIAAIVGPKGDIQWQHKIGDIHDAWLLPSGNVLTQTDWRTIVELTPDGQVAWKYDASQANGNAGKPVEVHAFQRLADGSTMIAESGPARIIEVDKEGKLLKEIKLQVEHPAPHTDTRQVRKLESGNYLVVHEGENRVIREYDPAGKVVWEYQPGSKAYSANRLASGNTLIGTGDGHSVVEVDPAGKAVWSVGEHDLPGITLAWVTMVERLPNGNTVIVNCHGGPDNPQMIEVTPDKKVVWTFKDFNRFGNALAVGRVLD